MATSTGEWASVELDRFRIANYPGAFTLAEKAEPLLDSTVT